MNNTQHTPGPWKCNLVSLKIWANDGNTEIARTSSDVSIHEEEANARLISASPELLSALQWFADELPEIIRQYCPEGVPIQVAHAHEAARNAIAKSKGEV